MSGHSKFANIKHKKEKNDAAKGKIFTIIGRELAVAVTSNWLRLLQRQKPIICPMIPLKEVSKKLRVKTVP